ncbi:hypothetical protein GH808_11530 [Acetobacterium fimetarium]|uniref:BIG2 domain-containing protein n=1 Tax=Acetobacterium fimetarium TaxID=52691 RepID=A0ABR6WX61_9FIRM|nr:hypothetical protein [Acetobacterium fimetarium]MBC3805061.1 hypothetical protein [Acetobacterium fimetarium]
MKKITVGILSAILMLFMVLSSSAFAAEENTVTTVAEAAGVRYTTHIENKGWESSWKTNGALSGTVGEALRLEALRVELTGTLPTGANIQTYVHVQDQGDLGPVEMGTVAGTEGKGLRLESIKLVLNNLPGYVLKYNVQVENKGWLKDENDNTNWFVGGEAAGTTGESLRLEAIKIVLIQTSDLTKYNAALAAVKEADYRTESWAAYKLVVDGNVVTMANTQTEINAATAAIVKAQQSLVKKTDLSVYNDALAAVTEKDYTVASWSAYQTVVNANVVAESDTQAKVNEAVVAILGAQKKLVKLTNLADYEAALAAVTEDQVKTGWNEYKAVVDANVVTAADTQVKVNAATTAILAAQKNLTFYSDMTEFNKAIALYLQYGAEADNAPYTKSTWDAYTAECELYGTLENGVWSYDVISKNSDQNMIKTAMYDISGYIMKLVKTADITAFNTAKNIKVTDGPYTTASFAAYSKDSQVKAITEIPIDTLKGYSQSVVDGYTNTLIALQNEILVMGADMTDYNAALAAVKESNYSPASWTAYQTVVAANVVTYENTQEDVAAATAEIVAAQKNLVYTAAYVLQNAKINTANFGVQHVGDSIITRAEHLIADAGFNQYDYTVSFTRIDNTIAVINPTTGVILNIGPGTVTVTFTVTPKDGSEAATTDNVKVVLN